MVRTLPNTTWSAILLLSLVLLGSLLSSGAASGTPEFFYWNEVTGETQWDDPGDVPHEESDGTRYWIDPAGKRHEQDPNAYQYVWVEQWSEDHGRPYYYNQMLGQSSWDKPLDMAWKRVRARDEL